MMKRPIPINNKTKRSTVKISMNNSFSLNSIRVELYNNPKNGIVAMTE